MHMYTLSRDVSWRLAAPICAYVYCPSRVVSFVVPRPKILCGAQNEQVLTLHNQATQTQHTTNTKRTHNQHQADTQNHRTQPTKHPETTPQTRTPQRTPPRRPAQPSDPQRLTRPTYRAATRPPAPWAAWAWKA